MLAVKFPTINFNISFSTGKFIVVFNNQTYSFWIDDWVYKNSIVIAIIQSITGNNTRVFARKCEVKKIDKKLAEIFLNENHLHGFKNAYYKYALINNNEIVAMATFSKGRKMNRLTANERSFELVSFCCKKGISVVGGLTKLLQQFITELSPGDIMTYVDKEWSNGQSYLKIGFKLHSETEPQTYIFDVLNNLKYKANQLPTEIVTALQNNHKNYQTIYNKGNLKLVYTPKPFNL